MDQAGALLRPGSVLNLVSGVISTHALRGKWPMKSMLIRYFSSHVDLSVSNRVITCLSFAYSEKKGPYLTAYYYTTTAYPLNGSRTVSAE